MKKRVKSIRKKVATGWIEDFSGYRDYHSSEAGKPRRDETLDDFGFQGHLGRVELHIPLITPRKEFWRGCRYLARKVKVTIEYV